MTIILFSLFFYGWWDWRFIGLILLSGTIDYFAALGISKHSASKRRWLVLSIVGNLGVLGFFKYYGFFAESLNLMLSRLGLEAAAPLISPVLPIGLSFYTFQSMSYTIDVYRRRLEPTRSFTLFFAYLTMFPQLVAGPICRAGDLMGQIEDLPATRREDFEAGLWLIVIGYFKKVVIADNVAPVVNQAFAGGLWDVGLVWWLIMALFSVQIYCDFSGYSDIAVGLGRWMGFRLPENFRNPYLAVSLRDFWQRWHISLSTWFRDYVYIPLGGSRGGRRRGVLALFATMLLSGLWHGAAWHFVVWGLVHATLMSAERWLRARGVLLSAPIVLRIAAVNVLVVVSWTLFRAETVAMAWDVFEQMFSLRLVLSGLSVVTWSAWMALILFSVMEIQAYRAGGRPGDRGSILAHLRLAGMILACIYLRGPGSAFVYFQF